MSSSKIYLLQWESKSHDNVVMITIQEIRRLQKSRMWLPGICSKTTRASSKWKPILAPPPLIQLVYPQQWVKTEHIVRLSRHVKVRRKSSPLLNKWLTWYSSQGQRASITNKITFSPGSNHCWIMFITLVRRQLKTWRTHKKNLSWCKQKERRILCTSTSLKVNIMERISLDLVLHPIMPWGQQDLQAEWQVQVLDLLFH